MQGGMSWSLMEQGGRQEAPVKGKEEKAGRGGKKWGWRWWGVQQGV